MRRSELSLNSKDSPYENSDTILLGHVRNSSNQQGIPVGVDNVTVRFGGTYALREVSFEAKPGEIHALAGQNGSGKTTLLNVISGTLAPSDGKVLIDDKRYSALSRSEAEKLGIGIVYQELSLFPHLTAIANVAIGHEPEKFGMLSKAVMRNRIASLAAEFGFQEINLDIAVGNLSVRDQQIVEILKCLYMSPRVVLFDEPTASLNRKLARQVLEGIKALKDAGLTVIFVSHFLDEVYEVADKVTVLRDGAVVSTRKVSDFSKYDLIKEMLGRELGSGLASKSHHENYLSKKDNKDIAINIKKVQIIPSGGLINFEVYRGEIIGLAGEIQSGAPELAEIIAGLRNPHEGIVEVHSKKTNREERIRKGVVVAQRKGDRATYVGYVGPNRRADGLLRGMSTLSNLTIASLKQFRARESARKLVRWGFIAKSVEITLAEEAVNKLDIKVSDLFAEVESLSGGNQQKVLLARWIISGRDILVLDNPTVGVDIGAREAIYDILRQYVEENGTVIIVSSDPQELSSICNRVIIFYDFNIVGELKATKLTEEEIVHGLQLGELISK